MRDFSRQPSFDFREPQGGQIPAAGKPAARKPAGQPLLRSTAATALLTKPKARKQVQKAEVEPLEPRILLSADLAPFAVAMMADQNDLTLSLDAASDMIQIHDSFSGVLVAEKARAETSSVEIEGSEGDDVLRMDEAGSYIFPDGIWFAGNGGNDQIIGADGIDATWIVDGIDSGSTEGLSFDSVETLTGGAQPRITSYFSNSPLAMQDGPATGRVAELLTPFADDLPAGALDGYALPVSDGSARNRAGIRRAMGALADAGFSADGGTMRGPDGQPLSFSILLSKGSSENIAIAELYIQALARLGITARVDAVDDAQFVARNAAFDFDMAIFRRALSLSPGNEQRYYWGSEAADQEGSRNLMGVQSPAIDAMIDTMVGASSAEDFTAAARALDRVLTAGRYVIPFWQFTEDRIAHVAALKYPSHVPLYGDGPNYMPEVWWIEPAQ